MSNRAAIDDRLLTIVSGKGGVGKTTVAASIASTHASRGRLTILIDGGGMARHALLDAPIGVHPHAVAENLYVARIDARLALKEYLRRRTAFGTLYQGLVDQPAVARFLDALPAFDELMTLGKLYDYCTGALTRRERVSIRASDVDALRRLEGERAAAAREVCEAQVALDEVQARHVAALAEVAGVLVVDEILAANAAQRMAGVQQQLPLGNP